MRSLTNAIESGGTDADTRELRTELNDIAADLSGGQDSCATAARMLGDNLKELEHHGIWGVLATNSASDIQHSYDTCDRGLTSAGSKLPSFRDSASRLRTVLAMHVANLRSRYQKVRAPLDWLSPPPPPPSLNVQSDDEQSGDSANRGQVAAPPEVQSAAPEANEGSSATTSPPASELTGSIISSAEPSILPADAPLRAGNSEVVLAGTSAIVVTHRTGSSGIEQTFVTVPDTPAKGIVESSLISGGRMADGRWVGVVPLHSGQTPGTDYALAWVWTNGAPRFIGEIPAENGGLGNLSMAVEDGAIVLRWPVLGAGDRRCCATHVRQKRLALHGVTLSVMSDEVLAERGR